MIDLVLAAPDLPDESALVAAAALAGLRVTRRSVDAADLLAAAATDPQVAIVLTVGVPRISADLVGRIAADDRRVLGLAVHEADAQVFAVWGITVVRPGGDALATMQAIASHLGVDEPRPERDEQCANAAGRLVAVWGPPGAPGRTTTAVSLAESLARTGERTCLADADTYAPGVGIALGLVEDACGLVLACRQAESGALTARTLPSACRAVSTHLAVLSGLADPSHWSDAREPALRSLWQVAKESFDIVVVDVGACIEEEGAVAHPAASALLASRRNAAALTALAAADVVVSVSSATTVGVARALSGIESLRAVTADIPQVHVVTGSRAGEARTAERVLRACGLPWPVTHLVRDSGRLERGMRAGRSPWQAAPRSERRAIADLARTVLAACA